MATRRAKKPQAIPEIPERDDTFLDARNLLQYIMRERVDGSPEPTERQYDVCDAMQTAAWKVVFGEDREGYEPLPNHSQIIVEAPRGEGKSLIAQVIVCWALYWNPHLNVFTASASEGFAGQFSTAVLSYIRTLEPLTWLTPLDGGRESVLKFDVSCANVGQHPSMKALGISGQLAGCRGDLIVVDDVETDENSRTDQEREKGLSRMSEIMAKAGETGETLDEASSQEYDTLADEIKTVDGHITRLKAHEAFMVSKGTPVQAQSVQSQEGASAVRGGAIISVKSNLPKGTEFARYAKCLAAAHGSRSEALEIAKTHYPDMPRLHTVLKAAVAAGTTTDSTWAGALVDYQHFSGDFVEYLRPMTILGRLQLRNVPFNIRVPRQTSGVTGGFVGEGSPAPVNKPQFDNITHPWAKVACITVITDELARLSNPSAEALIRDDLANGIAQYLDKRLVDPAYPGVANTSPASLTNGVTPETST